MVVNSLRVTTAIGDRLQRLAVRNGLLDASNRDILSLMVGASQQLMEVSDLLERALVKIDEFDDTFLGVLIDTALHDVNTKIGASKADE